MKIANKTISSRELVLTSWAVSPVGMVVLSVSIRFMPASLALVVAGAAVLAAAVAILLKLKSA